MNETIKRLYSIFREHPYVSTDSRQEMSGKIFFAIRGENFDGNRFIPQALEKGAVVAVSDDVSFTKNDRVIVVPDTVQCLQQLAACHRQQLDIPVIGITGSNGKTTTKELIFRVLQKKFRVFATQGNLNNHIGLPLSILSIDSRHEVAVIEIGANHLGETRLLTTITHPTTGVLTNIGKDHLGEFGGFDNVVEAYREFVDFFNQNTDYQLIVNGNDEFSGRLITQAKVLFFGEGNFTFNGRVVSCSPFVHAEIKYGNEIILVKSRLFGSYNLNNILAASAIGQWMNIPANDFQDAVGNYYPENLRSQVLEWRGNTVFLDAYNANPSSMSLAINDFAQLKTDKKILILGDMHELGEYSHQEHQEIISLLKKVDYQHLFLIGEYFGDFKNDIDCMHFKDVNEFILWFENQHFTGYSILIKGSRSERLEKILNIYQH